MGPETLNGVILNIESEIGDASEFSWIFSGLHGIHPGKLLSAAQICSEVFALRHSSCQHKIILADNRAAVALSLKQ